MMVLVNADLNDRVFTARYVKNQSKNERRAVLPCKFDMRLRQTFATFLVSPVDFSNFFDLNGRKCLLFK